MRFLYRAPFIFGCVPAFSLDGSASDIVATFIMVFIAPWACSWLLSGVGLKREPRGAATEA